MKRRYKALIAIIVPVLVMWILKYIHPISYNWIMGYMVAVALVFKANILSLWFASKLHILSFIKGLTLFQTFVIILKRWLLESVVTEWIKVHIVNHLTEGLHELKRFYLRVNLKTKLLNAFYLIFGTLVISWMLYFIGYLDNLLLFAELKLFIAGVLKAITLFFTKLFTWLLSWFAVSWLAPIIEVFALSYLLTLIEKRFGPDNPLGDRINLLLYYAGILKRKHIDPMVECKVISNSKRVGEKLSRFVQNKKIHEEYRHFDTFENIIMKGHINAYHSFEGMDKIEDKKKLYTLINQKTNDNIDIVAYVSRNHLGILLDEEITDTFYHDIFLLESFASHSEHGVKVYDEPLDEHHIDHTDFWVMNTSQFPVIIGSESNNFEEECIFPHGLRLIKTSKPFCYASGDVYCEYEGVKVAVTPIPRI
jgi:ABC-type multidrug transport system fused ATPase/permease subunit